MNPHIYRTHDGGKTWTEIVNGIPGGAPVSVVREDPKRKGLLFAGSETQVYVSFDDGDHWQSLRLNMAPSSVRDLVIKDDDLVVGTHGRGIWILDDITPLRQIDATTGASSDVVLFKPQAALRVRWNMNTDTPLPPDEPTRAESARRRDHRLLPEGRGVRSGHARDPRRATASWCAATRARTRCSAPDPATITDAALLVPAAAVAARRRRRACTASRGTCTISRSTAADARRRAEAADRGHRPQHRAGADDAVGAIPAPTP